MIPIFSSVLQASSRIIILTALLFSSFVTTAQSVSHVEGEILIQLHTDIKAQDWLNNWNQQQPPIYHLQLTSCTSRPSNIWLLSFDEHQVSDRQMLRAIRGDSRIEIAQFNHHIKMRSVPNDLNFGEQWQYDNTGQSEGTLDADIDATEAWDYTTGGTTINGDTIVIAVLDDGLDLDHPDLQNNRWYNTLEIPDNGIDDDNNGYIDDYMGWNIITNNDNIAGGGHGTPVAGIIGADGNNGQGVTGVNWQVKVMIIKNNFNTTESKVIEAYSYALEQRIRYNQSGGTQGAFVVATNASWGVANGTPEAAPIWCSFYDTLGEAGIINFGATANDGVNVDEVGDLPTTCTSNYLVAVTNTDNNDALVSNAAYGPTSIDLGAPGNGAYTLANGGEYHSFGGTSGATPHVAGVAALLYSVNCPSLMALVQSDPAAAALLIRSAILEGVDPLSSLTGLTTTGGRLNAHNSVQYLLEQCEGCLPASSIYHNNLTDISSTINWNTNDSLASVDLRWRQENIGEWTTINDAQSPLVIDSLLACTEYEYQLQSNCYSDTVFFQNSRNFITDGCCTAPNNLTLEAVFGDLAFFSWSSVLAALQYEFRYRKQGEIQWEQRTTSNPGLTLIDLEQCATYEYSIRTICTEEQTSWAPITTFISAGCGPCLEEDYCRSLDVLDPSSEYIQTVAIDDFFSNTSGPSTDGYEDFGQATAALRLEQGAAYSTTLTPGYPGTDIFPQDWRIWIDLDQNGSFSSNEIIFDTAASTEAVSGTIEIPENAITGVTRMRVLMQFNLASVPCPIISSFGEIEDYCVEIIPPSTCDEVEGLFLSQADYNSAIITWNDNSDAIGYEAEYSLANTSNWIPATVSTNEAHILTLDSCASYQLRVRSFCSDNTFSNYRLFSFNTCTVDTKEVVTATPNWQVAPNPFYEVINMKRLDSNHQWDVIIFNTLGQHMEQHLWPAFQEYLSLPMQDTPAGIYTVVIYENGQRHSQQRIVKTR